jgi:AraC family transcriptional regulator of adaptative response/methylated-DNA-[protein]-cysteine methyltransferase
MKQRLRDLLVERRLEEIAQLAESKKRVLGDLVSLTYDPERLVAWRAVEALGVAAARVAETDSAFVRGHLRRLHWLLSEESGAVCWYAPQAMAEIVRQRPDDFADYACIVATLLHTVAAEDLDHFRDAILWAIGRLGPAAIRDVEPVLPSIVACLDHADARVRGMAAWCLVQIGKRELLAGRADLLSDDGQVELYENGQIELTSVRTLVGG